MKNILIIVVLSCMLVLSSAVAFSGTWTSDTTVKQYIVEEGSSGHRIYVQITDPTNPDNCSDSSGRMRVFGDTVQGKHFFAAIMTAKVTSPTIQVSLSGCDNWNRPIVVGLMVK